MYNIVKWLDAEGELIGLFFSVKDVIAVATPTSDVPIPASVVFFKKSLLELFCSVSLNSIASIDLAVNNQNTKSGRFNLPAG